MSVVGAPVMGCPNHHYGACLHRMQANSHHTMTSHHDIASDIIWARSIARLCRASPDLTGPRYPRKRGAAHLDMLARGGVGPRRGGDRSDLWFRNSKIAQRPPRKAPSEAHLGSAATTRSNVPMFKSSLHKIRHVPPVHPHNHALLTLFTPPEHQIHPVTPPVTKKKRENLERIYLLPKPITKNLNLSSNLRKTRAEHGEEWRISALKCDWIGEAWRTGRRELLNRRTFEQHTSIRIHQI